MFGQPTHSTQAKKRQQKVSGLQQDEKNLP